MALFGDAHRHTAAQAQQILHRPFEAGLVMFWGPGHMCSCQLSAGHLEFGSGSYTGLSMTPHMLSAAQNISNWA